MTTPPRDDSAPRPPSKAEHGYRNEVSWSTGKGRQPYANQGEIEAGPAGAPEFEGGERGEHSGKAMDDLERVKQKP